MKIFIIFMKTNQLQLIQNVEWINPSRFNISEAVRYKFLGNNTPMTTKKWRCIDSNLKLTHLSKFCSPNLNQNVIRTKILLR
jgi:hypothetical protein